MTADDRTDDPAQRDLAWVGYHPRAIAPAAALAAVASLVVWTGRWYLDDLSELADRVGALALFALAWGVWPALAAVFLYRTVTYTYRLTDRAVLVDFGFLARPVPPVPLAEVTAVVAGGGWVWRWFGVGWVEVRTADRAVRLPGIRRPAGFAQQIRVAAKKTKEEVGAEKAEE
jgi:membrane protein YdbS with pleckstrin-like domain